jgi:cephalosporin hydroxylase
MGQQTWWNTRFLGAAILKCPLDLWVYQEIIHELRPDVIIETGTAFGGSALYMASICDLIGKGRVITIDITPQEKRPKHERITYLTGSSVASEMVERVRDAIGHEDTVMVILDSDHSRRHVLEEMRLYAPLITKGSYLIVEDTNVYGHPVRRSHGPGPMEAVESFLKESEQFAIDDTREKFYLTFNPRGYLKKLA